MGHVEMQYDYRICLGYDLMFNRVQGENWQLFILDYVKLYKF